MAEMELAIAKSTLVEDNNENHPSPNNTDDTKSQPRKRNGSLARRGSAWVASRLHVERQANDIVKEFSQITTTHGLGRIHHHVSQGSWVFGCMWMLAFLVMTLLFLYNITTRIQLYLSKPVTTQLLLLSESPMTFADVTFCPMNPYSRTRFNVNATALGLNITTAYVDKSHIDAIFMNSSIEEFYNTYKYWAFSYEEMVSSCSFGELACGPEDFVPLFSRDTGNCYRFEPTNKQTQAGSSYGLQLVFHLDVDDVLFTNYFSSRELGLGFKLVPHASNEDANMNNALLIKRGAQTSITISRADYIDETKTNCTQIKDGERYSSVGCVDTCIEDGKAENCGCSTPEECGSSQRTCLSDRTLSSSLSATCAAKCLELCERTVYSASLSSAEWPAEQMSPALYELATTWGICQGKTRDECYSLVTSTSTLVSIYFGSFTYQEFTQSHTYGITELLAELGGSAGLYIGCSLLSLVEFCELLYLLFASQISRAAKRQKREK